MQKFCGWSTFVSRPWSAVKLPPPLDIRNYNQKSSLENIFGNYTHPHPQTSSLKLKADAEKRRKLKASERHRLTMWNCGRWQIWMSTKTESRQTWSDGGTSLLVHFVNGHWASHNICKAYSTFSSFFHVVKNTIPPSIFIQIQTHSRIRALREELLRGKYDIVLLQVGLTTIVTTTTTLTLDSTPSLAVSKGRKQWKTKKTEKTERND